MSSCTDNESSTVEPLLSDPLGVGWGGGGGMGHNSNIDGSTDDFGACHPMVSIDICTEKSKPMPIFHCFSHIGFESNHNNRRCFSQIVNLYKNLCK